MWFFDFLKGFFRALPQSRLPNHRDPWVRKEEHPVSWDDSVLAETQGEAEAAAVLSWSCAHAPQAPTPASLSRARPLASGQAMALGATEPGPSLPARGSVSTHTRVPITRPPQAGMRTRPRRAAEKEKSPGAWRRGSRPGALASSSTAVLKVPALQGGESTPCSGFCKELLPLECGLGGGGEPNEL